MRLSLRVRELVLASWPTDSATIARAIHPALEPAEVGGEHLVSLVGIRVAGGRLGRSPVPPFAQLNARTYVESDAGPGVFFLRSYVTASALPGILFGAPLRFARIRVGADRVGARGVGVDLALRVGARAEPGDLGEHELGLFEAAGLRAFRIQRGPAEWHAAEPVGEPRADLLLALGFELGGPPRLFYAGGASFEAELPPRKISASRSRR